MRRSPRERRVLGLWTAGCLAVLLLVGLAWVGNWALQWWVLLVPVVWALVALLRGGSGPRSAGRHRGGPGGRREG